LAKRIGAGGFHVDIRWNLANAENDLIPAMRVLLEELLDDLAYIEGRIKTVNAKVEAYADEHDAVSRLVTIPGIGALGATALVAAVGNGRQFRKARDLAAWLGLVPAELSTGGKQALLGISKRDDRFVRRLIIHGAMSCFLRLNRTNHALVGWLSTLGSGLVLAS
jgi:transposase